MTEPRTGTMSTSFRAVWVGAGVASTRHLGWEMAMGWDCLLWG